MEYVIPAILVVLLVGGLVIFIALRATQKGGPVADEGGPGIGRDPTPLGDTTEHAGEQSERGTTIADPEQGARGRADDDVVRPGEGEGAERLERESDRPQPTSERLADRDA
jgi:hypothetical protein